MDPLSIATSAFSLAGAIGKTALAISGLISTAREAEGELEGISRELDSLRTVILSIVALLKGRAGGTVPETLRELPVIVGQCIDVVVSMETTVRKFQDENKVFSMAKWALYGQKDMERRKATLESHKSLIEMALTVLDLSVSAEVKRDTGVILEDTAGIKQVAGAIFEDTQGIMSKLDRLVQQIRETQGRAAGAHEGKDLIMQRFIDDITTYAQTTYQESVMDPTELGQSEAELAPRRPPRHMTDLTEEGEPEPAAERQEAQGSRARLQHINSMSTATVTSTRTIARRILWDEEAVAQGEAKRKALSEDEKRRLDLSLLCINAGTSPDYIRDRILQGASPNAIYDGQVELVDHSHSVGDPFDCGPLFWAVWYGNDACLEMLLSCGADAKRNLVAPATVLAVIMGNVNAVRLFRDAGVSMARLDTPPFTDLSGNLWHFLHLCDGSIAPTMPVEVAASNLGVHIQAAAFAGTQECPKRTRAAVAAVAKRSRGFMLHTKLAAVRNPAVDQLNRLDNRLGILDIALDDYRAGVTKAEYHSHALSLSNLLALTVSHWGSLGDEQACVARAECLLRGGAKVRSSGLDDIDGLQYHLPEGGHAPLPLAAYPTSTAITSAVRLGLTRLFWLLYHAQWLSSKETSRLAAICAYAALLGRLDIVDGIMSQPDLGDMADFPVLHNMVRIWAKSVVLPGEWERACTHLIKNGLDPDMPDIVFFEKKSTKAKLRSLGNLRTKSSVKDVTAITLAQKMYLAPTQMKAMKEGGAATRDQVVKSLRYGKREK